MASRMLNTLHFGNGDAVGYRGAHFCLDLPDSGVVSQILPQFWLPVAELLSPPVTEHHLADQLGTERDPRAGVQVGRHREHLEHPVPGLLRGSIQLLLAGHPGLQQPAGVGGYRVGRLPELHFLFRPVARCVGRRMTAGAVGDRVQQNRAAAVQQDLLLALDGVDHRERVVAVHPLRVHLLGIHSSADPRDELTAHGLAVGLTAHPVEVVHDVEQHRQAAAE